MNRITTAFLLSLCSLYPNAHAQSVTESEFLAAKVISEDISIWLSSEEKAKSIAVFVLQVSPPLPNSYADVLESEILRTLRDLEGKKVSACLQCRSPQVKVDGDRLVISRGIPDSKTMRKIGQSLQTDALLTVSAQRTSTAVHAHATLYTTGNSDVIAAESFRVPAIDISGVGTQIIFMAAPGLTIGGDSTDDSTSPFSGNIVLLEELGFGKAGITLGAIIAGDQGSLGYILPTLAWRGRLFGRSTQTLTSLSAGYGVGKEKSGILVRSAYDLFLGTFTNIGIEAAYLIPLKTKVSGGGTFDGFIGLHLGLSFGR